MTSPLQLGTLSLSHFRNLGVQELELPPEGVAIVGPNAHGKSNLIEAIYYLETFRSFRGARDERLLAFGEPVFRVVGTFGSDTVAAAFQREGKKKKVTLRGQEPERLGDALGHAAAVVFSPGDVDVVSGAPSERRRFLDVVLSLADPAYLRALQRYRSALTQRNAALKAGAGSAAVAAWNEGLVSEGALIMASRRKWVADRHDAFCTIYQEISGGRPAGMVYQSSVTDTREVADDALRDRFEASLAASRDRERRLATTVVGPHRDELVLSLGGVEGRLDLRAYGSGGQRRTAALALRMLEADTVREARGRTPILLLDDVFAELDEGRSRRILERIEGNPEQQVILTAPKEADIRVRRDTIPRWRIEAGVVMS